LPNETLLGKLAQLIKELHKVPIKLHHQNETWCRHTATNSKKKYCVISEHEWHLDSLNNATIQFMREYTMIQFLTAKNDSLNGK
jgi:hypothetical protein